MPLPYVPPNPFLQLGETARLWSLGEQLPMDLLRAVTAGPPYHDAFAILVPFQNRAGADTELAPDFSV